MIVLVVHLIFPVWVPFRILGMGAKLTLARKGVQRFCKVAAAAAPAGPPAAGEIDGQQPDIARRLGSEPPPSGNQ